MRTLFRQVCLLLITYIHSDEKVLKLLAAKSLFPSTVWDSWGVSPVSNNTAITVREAVFILRLQISLNIQYKLKQPGDLNSGDTCLSCHKHVERTSVSRHFTFVLNICAKHLIRSYTKPDSWHSPCTNINSFNIMRHIKPWVNDVVMGKGWDTEHVSSFELLFGTCTMSREQTESICLQTGKRR